MKRHLLLFALLLLSVRAMLGQHLPEAPSLTVDTTSLSFSYNEGYGPSESQQVIITGSNLTTNVNVNSSSEFEVRTSDGDFGEPIGLSPDDDGSLSAAVYVRMKSGLQVGDYQGILSITCGNLSETVSLSGTVTPQPIVQTPTFDPDGATYPDAQDVTISCETEGATIRYTLDNTDPTESSSVYFSPLHIQATTTVKAKAWKDGYQPSQIASATYNINIPDPSLNVSPNSINNFTYVFGYGPSESQQVTITGSNLTTNVNVNSSSEFEVRTSDGDFGEPIGLSPDDDGSLSAAVYVRMKSGLQVGDYQGTLSITCGNLSETVSLSGTIIPQPIVQTPTFDPDGATYPDAQDVTISCETEGATIRYTLDNTDPTESSSVYSSPLHIQATTTVKAKAWKDGYQPSQIASATYNINYSIDTDVTPEGSGMVTGGGGYHYGDHVTLTATPSSGYYFVIWNDGDEQNPREIIVTGNATYTANFSQIDYTITVNASPSNAGQVTGGGTYHYGDTLTLTATANQHYSFSQWHDGNTDNPRNITVTDNATYTANFSINQYTITALADPEEGGYVMGGGTYNYNAHVVLTAIPNPGYSFLRWDDGNTQNPRTITVTGNATYTATFSQDNYIISVEVTPEGSGTVTGGGAYHYGDNARLIATPNASYEFLSWNDGNTNNPRDIIVTQSATYTAHFGEVGVTYYNVTATVIPEGTGYVTGTGSFPTGSQTTLTANPNTGYTFDHWQDGSQQNPRNVIVNGNMAFTAYFTQDIYTITVQVSPPGSGTVTGGGNYHYGEQATLNAIPNNGYSFDRWNDGIQQNPRTITVTGNSTYIAYFEEEVLPEYIITTEVLPEDAGEVEGGGTYTQGTTVTLKAIPNEHYTFNHWQDENTQNPRQITVTSNATYTATFAPKQYYITTKVEPVDAGTVTGGGQHDYGELVELEAIAEKGYTFEHWQDGNTDNPRQIRVTGDATYTAIFTPNKYNISVRANPVDGGLAYIGDTPGTIQQEFTYGDNCTIHARPNDGFTFVNWTDVDGVQYSGLEDYSFTITGGLDLVANFAEEGQIIIYVDIYPEEGGTVTGAGVYSPGDDCTLKAFPKPGYEFVNWTLGDEVVCEDANYTFTVNETARYTAHFERKKYHITVISIPEEGGDVTGDGYYYYNATVTLEAIAKPGFTFNKWVDSDTVFITQETSFTFRVKEDATYFAIFTQDLIFTINAIADPEEGGTVTVSGNGTFGYGNICTLTATANTGYKFSNWTLNDQPQPISNVAIYEFQVTEDATFTAHFTPIEQYYITVTALPAEGGMVIGSGTYYEGEQVTLKATANANYTFVNWIENGIQVSTHDSYTFSATANRDLVAVFKKETCIDNLQEIVAKDHKDGSETYVLILVYPNPNNEDYSYQWLYSSDGEIYHELTEGTAKKQYYYKGGHLKDGYYKVRISKDGCSEETLPYHVNDGGRLHIYPNPSHRGTGVVVVNDSDSPAQLTIYSTDGRVLHTQTVTSDQATIGINLPQGVYVAYLTTSDGYTKIGKLIIQ